MAKPEEFVGINNELYLLIIIFTRSIKILHICINKIIATTALGRSQFRVDHCFR